LFRLIGKEQAIGPALGDQARAFARAAFAANSRRAYAAQWRLWLAHCEASGLPSLPAAPEVVADWIASRAVSGMRAKYGHGGQSVATLRMAIAAIRAAHAVADQPFHSRHRAITLVMRGIAREKAELPAQAAPLQAKLIVEILAELGDSPLERRATQPSWRSAIAFRVDAPSWPASIMPSLVAVMASSRSQPRCAQGKELGGSGCCRPLAEPRKCSGGRAGAPSRAQVLMVCTSGPAGDHSSSYRRGRKE
jgi:hypothetical protein